MEAFTTFLANNYLWFLVIAIILIFALIGYFVDASEQKKGVSSIVKQKSVEKDIHDLPDTLHNALKSLANDEVIKSSMGEHLYNSFMEAKTREYASYRQHVSDWERQHYMEQY